MMHLLFVDNWNAQEVSHYQTSNNYMAEAGWSQFSVNVGFKTDLSRVGVLPKPLTRSVHESAIGQLYLFLRTPNFEENGSLCSGSQMPI